MVNFSFKENYNIDDLIEIVDILRGENGCPWDMKQTHSSIRNDMLEEACEVIEAIDLDDKELLREELGDVLLQVVFHSSIEKEKNVFDFENVCSDICKKLIVRHPHVFGDIKADNVEKVLENWDDIKKKTKGQETYTDTLTSVAKSLPALMRAEKVGKRAMRAGMDFRSVQDAFDCIYLETDELKQAIENGSQSDIEEELGDLLFSCVNTARHLGIDAEQALFAATEKFIKRFAKTEELLRLEGVDMKSLSIDELDVLWRKAKENL